LRYFASFVVSYRRIVDQRNNDASVKRVFGDIATVQSLA
jgi:hypothetical protein